MMSAPARIFAVVCLFFASFVLVSAQSSTFTVNTMTDSVDANTSDGLCADSNGMCSLRAAIMEANANADYTEIILGAGDYVTTLTSGPIDESFGDLDITQSTQISGSGADKTFISNGVTGERVMELSQGANIAWGRIENLTLRNGESSSEGGGLYIASEAIVYLLNIEVTDNQAANGGGIWVESMTKSLVLADSSIVNNTATGSCGGLYVGSTDNDVIQNITFYGNAALTGAGGAVCFSPYASQPDHRLPVLNYVTITQNSAGTSGGGIMSYNADHIWLANSIVLQNNADISGANCAHGTPSQPVIFNGTGSVFDLQGCSSAGETGLVTDAPVLGTLGLYAPGKTRMVNLVYGSPALDLTLDPLDCNYDASHDQRGTARPQGPSCDAGAYEMEQGPAQTYTVNTAADTIDVALGDAICADASGNCSLRAALMQANAFGNSDTVIIPAGHYISSLTAGPTDDSYGDFDILQAVTIQGANADETIISSGIAGERVFEINVPRIADPDGNWENNHIDFERINITNGNTSENGGGIFIDTGLAVYLTDSEVANNTAANGGGIWIENAYTFWTDRSTIAENTATDSCGGIYAGDIPRILHARNVTIAGNSAVAGEGGGLCLSEETSETHIDLSFLTIARNSAATIGGGILNRNTHGPIADAGSNGPYFIVISIISDNMAGSTGANCAFAGGATRALNSAGYNMFDTNGCVNAVPEDIVTSTTGIGTLSLHAPGNTRTISLLPDSSAIDAYFPDYIGTDIDQRGAPRQSGYGIDIGAYELTAPGAWVLRPELPPNLPDLFPLNVAEGGPTSNFQIFIGSEPQGTVVYTFSDAGSDLSFSPAQIVFTADNWDDAGTGIVTVSAVDDIYVENLENTEVIITVSGTAPEYTGVVPLDPITVEITDNDSLQIIVTPSVTPPLIVSEDGTTTSFDVSINSVPTGTVTVTFGGAGSDFALSLPSVEFNASNWQTPVTVTVSTSDDGIVEGTKNGAITFMVGGTAAEYAGITLPNLPVTVLDDDSASINIIPSASPLPISEDGTTASFDVSINSLPTGTVTVTFGGAGSDFVLSLPSVEFNASNWQTPVTVTVSAIDDADAEGTENTAVTFSVSGTSAEYSGVTHADLPVTITDNDLATVTEDLITNGGWETGGVTAWKYNSAKAKRQCKGTGNGSNCALLLKPGLPVAMAYQAVSAALIPFAAGETLHFEFAAKISGSAKLVAMLKFKYKGGTTAKLKIKPVPANTGGAWVTHSFDHSNAKLSKVKAIRVEFRHNGATGKIRVDDVVLQRLSHEMLPRGEVIPLPVPPEGFRGEN